MTKILARVALALAAGLIVFSFAAPVHAQLPAAGEPCPASTAAIAVVCHQGYIAEVDRAAKVPRLVAYRLTGPHTLGCFKRTNNFHAEFTIRQRTKTGRLITRPAPGQALPKDYAGSGYDLGHMAPAEDFAWNAVQERESFSLANMAPQAPGLNRQGWERLEETVRAWAWARGAVDVYVGPVLAPGDTTIGADQVEVPTAFWKVVVDPAAHAAIAFEMPNRPVAKGDLAPYLVALAAVDKILGAPIPVVISEEAAAKPGPLWPADLTGYRRAAASACPKRHSANSKRHSANSG